MAEPAQEREKQVDPRMHTAEHILTATLMKLAQTGRPFTTHIEKKKSKADYRLDRDLTLEEVARVQAQVNEIIRQNLPVTEEFLTHDDAAKSHDLGRLPAEAREAVRIIHVGDYDACPCIGPHVSSTSQIGSFQIVSTTYQEGFLRVRFKLGGAD